MILADRRDGAELCCRGISSSPCFSSSLVCWVPEETFPVLCYKAVRSPSTEKQSLQSLAAVSPNGENSGSYHCGDPSVLGLCGPPALFGGWSVWGTVFSHHQKSCVYGPAQSCDFCQSPDFLSALTGLSGNAFLVMLFRGVLLCVSCQCCSCLLEHQCWPPASTALPFLPSCLLVNTHCQVQTLFLCACKGSSTCTNPRVTREHREC